MAFKKISLLLLTIAIAYTGESFAKQEIKDRDGKSITARPRSLSKNVKTELHKKSHLSQLKTKKQPPAKKPTAKKVAVKARTPQNPTAKKVAVKAKTPQNPTAKKVAVKARTPQKPTATKTLVRTKPQTPAAKKVAVKARTPQKPTAKKVTVKANQPQTSDLDKVNNELEKSTYELKKSNDELRKLLNDPKVKEKLRAAFNKAKAKDPKKFQEFQESLNKMLKNNTF